MLRRVDQTFAQHAREVLGNAGSSRRSRMPICRRDAHHTLGFTSEDSFRQKAALAYVCLRTVLEQCMVRSHKAQWTYVWLPPMATGIQLKHRSRQSRAEGKSLVLRLPATASPSNGLLCRKTSSQV